MQPAGGVVWDAVVVGLGGVGSFCLRALARGAASTSIKNNGSSCSSSYSHHQHHQHHPMKVLGLEAFARGHDRGSSHGGTRIYRRAYFEHANYVPWIEYSINEFRALEQSSGVALMQECGTLLIEPQSNKDNINGLDSNNNNNINSTITETTETMNDDDNKDNEVNKATTSQHCTKSFLERAWDSARQHNIPVQYLTNEELKRSYPQFHITDDDSVGLLEPGGGFVRPERAMVAALQQAEQQGATIWEHTNITSIREVQDPTNNGANNHSNNNNNKPLVEIQIHRNGCDETVLANTVLVAAGAWTGKLLPTLAPHIKVTRQIQGWLDMGDTPNPSLFLPSNMPTWVMISPHVTLPLYGVPADLEEDDEQHHHHQQQRQQQYWIKVGLHGRDHVVDPSYPQSSAPPTRLELQELQHGYSQVLLPHTTLFPTTTTTRRGNFKAKSCYYSMTRDHHFIIGVPRGYTNVGCVAGLSGHGFKMAPALGQMLADFALLQRQQLPSNDKQQQQQQQHRQNTAIVHNNWATVEQQWKTQFCSPARFGV